MPDLSSISVIFQIMKMLKIYHNHQSASCFSFFFLLFLSLKCIIYTVFDFSHNNLGTFTGEKNFSRLFSCNDLSVKNKFIKWHMEIQKWKKEKKAARPNVYIAVLQKTRKWHLLQKKKKEIKLSCANKLPLSCTSLLSSLRSKIVFVSIPIVLTRIFNNTILPPLLFEPTEGIKS